MWLKANDGYYLSTDKEGYLNVNAKINGKPAEVLLDSSDKVAGFTFDFTIPKDDFMLGDVNGDGDITIMDATAIQLHIAQLEMLPEDKLACADTDGDGKIAIMDATQIQLFIAQLIPEL